MSEQATFEGWAVVEIMGHRKLAGFLREVTLAGAGFLRLDVPADGDYKGVTQFYPPSSVYCITPVGEEVARAAAKRARPEPVQVWELPPKRDDVQDGDVLDDAGEDGF